MSLFDDDTIDSIAASIWFRLLPLRGCCWCCPRGIARTVMDDDDDDDADAVTGDDDDDPGDDPLDVIPLSS